MFWAALLSGVIIIAMVIEAHGQLPLRFRIAVGLVGTALVITAVFFL